MFYDIRTAGRDEARMHLSQRAVARQRGWLLGYFLARRFGPARTFRFQPGLVGFSSAAAKLKPPSIKLNPPKAGLKPTNQG